MVGLGLLGIILAHLHIFGFYRLLLLLDLALSGLRLLLLYNLLGLTLLGLRDLAGCVLGLLARTWLGLVHILLGLFLCG